jgi:hypothetical protein
LSSIKPNMCSLSAFASATVLLSLLPNCEIASEGPGKAEPRDGDTEGDVEQDAAGPSLFSVVYRQERTISPNGEVAILAESGVLPDDLASRLRQPFFAAGQVRAYADTILVDEHDDGSRTHRRVVETFEGAVLPVVGEEPFVRPKLEESLAEMAASASEGLIDGDSPVTVCAKVANFVASDLPSVPDETSASAAELDAAIAEQLAAHEVLLADFMSAHAGAIEFLTEKAITLSRPLPTIGWMCGQVRVSDLILLAEHPGLARLVPDAVLAESRALAAEPREVAIDPEALWAQLPMSTLRQPAYTQLNLLYNQGYLGASSKIGIIEITGIEDEGCFLDESNGCYAEERISGRFRCYENCIDPPEECECLYLNSSDWDESVEGAHATQVASIALADFQHNQSNPNASSGEPVLAAGWRDKATGFAQWARGVFFAVQEQFAVNHGLAAAFLCASGDHAVHPNCGVLDATNLSATNPNEYCDIYVSNPGEDSLEVAFEAGVLPVVASGNEGDDNSTDCTVNAPGDAPLSITVGELAHNKIDPNYDESYVRYTSSWGGAVGNFGPSYLEKDTLTMVDLTAPAFMTHTYVPSGDNNGYILPDYVASLHTLGTSFAAPVVAGIAAVLKDRYSQIAPELGDSAGRYATILFSMADRKTAGSGFTSEPLPGTACIFGDKLRCGVDFKYGFGRVKVTHPNVWLSTQLILTPAAPNHRPPSLALPANTQLAKCTLLQHEAMRDKTNLSRVELILRIVDKYNGNCISGSGTVQKVRTDAHYNYEHMVAILDEEVTNGGIGGKCLETELRLHEVSNDQYVRAYLFCSGNDNLDDEID